MLLFRITAFAIKNLSRVCYPPARSASTAPPPG